jgi:hypothetical protein
MKTSIQPNLNKLKKPKFKTGLAKLAGIGLLALAAACFVVPVHADGQATDNTQVAQLDQLAADFHGALSYGGNITNMMSLWADDSSITFNGTAHVGKAAVQAFFQSSGYFLNNWVSLAPEYKTRITIRGNTATITTQCVAIDLSASPMVVKSVTQLNASCEKIEGQWLFTSMNNTAPAPL